MEEGLSEDAARIKAEIKDLGDGSTRRNERASLYGQFLDKIGHGQELKEAKEKLVKAQQEVDKARAALINRPVEVAKTEKVTPHEKPNNLVELAREGYRPVNLLNVAGRHKESPNTVTIGRSKESDLSTQLSAEKSDDFLSNSHAKLSWQAATGNYVDFYIEDLGSTNGTYIQRGDGKPEQVKPQTKQILANGDKISFSKSHQFEFRLIGGVPYLIPEKAFDELEVRGDTVALNESDPFMTEALIGRAEPKMNEQWVALRGDRMNRISRRHALLQATKTGLKLTDLQSSNGTMVLRDETVAYNSEIDKDNFDLNDGDIVLAAKSPPTEYRVHRDPKSSSWFFTLLRT